MDDYAVFRAAHPSISSAIDACTRPDWLVHLAVEAVPREAVRIAVRAARLLTNDAGYFRFLRPWPAPFEALDIYTAYQPFEDRRLLQWGRPALLALIPSGILNAVVVMLIWRPSREIWIWLASLLLVPAFAIPLAVLFKALLARAVRKHVERLDNDAAVEESLALIARGAAKDPRSARYVMSVVRTEIAEAMQLAS